MPTPISRAGRSAITPRRSPVQRSRRAELLACSGRTTPATSRPTNERRRSQSRRPARSRRLPELSATTEGFDLHSAARSRPGNGHPQRSTGASPTTRPPGRPLWHGNTPLCVSRRQTIPRFHPDTAALIAEALLGTSIAAQYISFMEHKRLPDPESLLEDPASLRLPLRGDLKLACLRAVTAAVSDNCTARRWAAAFEVCIRAAQAGALDAAMVAAEMLAAIRPARVRLPAGYEILLAVAAELTKTGRQAHTSLSAETSPQDPAQPPSGTTARRLCAARYWIAKERPYYTTALFRCPLWTTRATANLSIDNRWRIYANPAHVASSTIEELALRLMHLTHHVLRAHDLRAPTAHNPRAAPSLERRRGLRDQRRARQLARSPRRLARPLALGPP